MTIADDQPAGPAIHHRDGDDAKIVTVPEPLRRVLAPATRIVFEWTPYLVAWPGATELRVGSTSTFLRFGALNARQRIKVPTPVHVAGKAELDNSSL